MIQASSVANHYTARVSAFTNRKNAVIESILRSRLQRHPHRRRMRDNLRMGLEIPQTHKCAKGPCIPPWNSVDLAPNGAHKAAHIPDRFAGAVLHVLQRSIRGVEAKNIMPGLKYTASGWKYEDRLDLGRKIEGLAAALSRRF